MSTTQGGAAGSRPPLPSRGSFSISEVLPMMQTAAAELRGRRDEWSRLREHADRQRSEAKRLRATLIVTLRTWGNDVTHEPIKTSAERQEWADSDPEVQQAELDADLAQTAAMAAREAYNDAQAQFNLVNGLLGMERDDMKREHGDPR